MTRLYLVRHGQTVWNQEKRFQGSLNSELTTLGVRQAELLSKRLEKIKIDVVYSSPMKRAIETAKIITNDGLDIKVDDAFAEMSFGNWEGRFYHEVNELEPDMFYALFNEPENYLPTTGESFIEVRTRVVGRILELLNNHSEETILIVAHGIVIKSIISFFESKAENKLSERLVVPSASLSSISLDDGIVDIEMYADVSHLSELLS